MIALILSFLIAAALLMMLVVTVTRPREVEGGAQAILEARQALQSLQDGLLPTELVARVFSKEDREYVKAVAPESVQRMFLEGRREIGLAWIRQVRRQVQCLRKFHFGRLRHYARLPLETEIGLAWSFLALLAECRILHLLISVGGFNSAPRLLGRATTTAGKVCAISGESLRPFEPATVDAGEGSL